VVAEKISAFWRSIGDSSALSRWGGDGPILAVDHGAVGSPRRSINYAERLLGGDPDYLPSSPQRRTDVPERLTYRELRCRVAGNEPLGSGL
jgi:hypothetical protein